MKIITYCCVFTFFILAAISAGSQTAVADSTKKDTARAVSNKKAKKKKKNDDGENPYLVPPPNAKTIPYNAPRQKPDPSKETPIGDIIRGVVEDKKNKKN